MKRTLANITISKKQLMLMLVIGLLTLLLVGTVMALSEQETYSKITNFWSKLRYGFAKGYWLFTTWGQENCCSEYADVEAQIFPVYESGLHSVSCAQYCVGEHKGFNYDKCAIDLWWSDTQGETYDNWYGEIKGEGVSFTNTAGLYYWIQIYCCPEACEIEEHETRVYVCEEGEWVNKGLYSSTDTCPYDRGCWCSNENYNKYYDDVGNEHCVISSYSSVNDGTWCPEEPEDFCTDSDGKNYKIKGSVTFDGMIEWDYCDSAGYLWENYCDGTVASGEVVVCEDEFGSGWGCSDGKCVYEEPPIGECTIEEDKCIGTTYYKCENEEWVNKGKVVGKCGVEEEPEPEPECRKKEEIFYTNIEGRWEEKVITIGAEGEVTLSMIDEHIPGFSAKYFETKAQACCEDLDYVYEDSISKSFTPVSIIWGLIAHKEVSFSYDVYKCVPEGEAGFCIEIAHKWLKDITKSDSCQSNTIIFIVIIFGGLILVSRLMG